MNPRAAINDLHPFQGCPFGQLGYFSTMPEYKINIQFLIAAGSIIIEWNRKPTERVGFEPTRPFGQTVFKTASL